MDIRILKPPGAYPLRAAVQGIHIAGDNITDLNLSIEYLGEIPFLAMLSSNRASYPKKVLRETALRVSGRRTGRGGHLSAAPR